MTLYLAWLGEYEPLLQGIYSYESLALEMGIAYAAKAHAEMIEHCSVPGKESMLKFWKSRGPEPVRVEQRELVEVGA